jgi:hypothetical protein
MPRLLGLNLVLLLGLLGRTAVAADRLDAEACEIIDLAPAEDPADPEVSRPDPPRREARQAVVKTGPGIVTQAQNRICVSASTVAACSGATAADPEPPRLNLRVPDLCLPSGPRGLPPLAPAHAFRPSPDDAPLAAGIHRRVERPPRA